jgi:hypothetical protein
LKKSQYTECNIGLEQGNTVMCRPVARAADSVMQTVSGQQLDKHVPMAMNTHTTTEEQYFLCGPCQELITRTAGAVRQLSSARKAEKR